MGGSSKELDAMVRALRDQPGTIVAAPAAPPWAVVGHCPECGCPLLTRTVEAMKQTPFQIERTCSAPCGWAPGGSRWASSYEADMDRVAHMANERNEREARALASKADF